MSNPASRVYRLTPRKSNNQTIQTIKQFPLIFRIARFRGSVVQLWRSGERRVRSSGTGTIDCPRGKGENIYRNRVWVVSCESLGNLRNGDTGRRTLPSVQFRLLRCISIGPSEAPRMMHRGRCLFSRHFRCLTRSPSSQEGAATVFSRRMSGCNTRCGETEEVQ